MEFGSRISLASRCKGLLDDHFYFIKCTFTYPIPIGILLFQIGSLRFNPSYSPSGYLLALFYCLAFVCAAGSYIESNIPKYRTAYSIFLLESVNLTCFILGFNEGGAKSSTYVQISTLVSVLSNFVALRYKWLGMILQIKTAYLWTFVYVEYSMIHLLAFVWISGLLMICTIKRDFLISRYLKSSSKVSKHHDNFLNILESMASGLIVLNSEQKLKFKNETFMQQFGIFQDEEISKYLHSLEYSPGRRLYTHTPASSTIIQDAIHYFNSNSNSPVLFGVTKHMEHYYEWKGSISIWSNKKCLVLVARRATHIMDFEKSRTEQLYMTAILRSFSHELRTPTSAIISANEQVLDSIDRSNPKILQNLQIVRVSSMLLLSLIDDLIDFVLITRGKFQLNYKLFHTRELIRETFDLFVFQSSQKSIALIHSIDPLVPDRILSDPGCIQQVLINLLSNALKFTFKGSILLSLKMKENAIKFCVKDTGIGINNDRLHKLFNLFETAESAGLQVHGCGLGLHISSMLVEQLGGGKISVKSKLGIGTQFCFLLDIEDRLCLDTVDSFGSIDEEVNPIYIPPSIPSFSKSRNTSSILVVDDNDFNRMILKEILSREGYKCKEAINGLQAVEMIKQANRYSEGYKVVIMDCQMPVMDGWEASIQISRMREQDEILYMPAIIAHTAYSGSEEEAKSLASGMVDFLRKPARREEIIRVLSRYLN
jgi:CheY-like chemotaxis protein/nitrogen-specific signal transduction histidine kinase